MKSLRGMLHQELCCSFSGLITLLSLFLPFNPSESFFFAVYRAGPRPLAPAILLLLALTSILYALGCTALPQVLSFCLTASYLMILSCGIYLCGLPGLLGHLRGGVWLTLAGLAMMLLGPCFLPMRERFPC